MKHFLREVIALNKFPYAEKIQLRGRNPGLDTSAETVWNPGASYAQLTAGVAMEVLSDSVSDAAAGTGARTVVIEGIDGNYAAFTETVVLNGTSVVPLVKTSVIGINKFYVATAGSGLVNAGNITVRTVTGSTTKSRIVTNAQSRGRATDFIYTTPVGHIGLLSSIDFSSITITGDLSVWLISRDAAGIERTEGFGKSSLNVTAFNDGKGKIDFQSGLLIPEKTQIELRGIVGAGVGDLVAQAELLLFDVKNCGLF